VCPPLEMYQGYELEPMSRQHSGHALAFAQLGESGIEFRGFESQVETLQESLDKLQALIFATIAQGQSSKVAEIANLSARTGGSDDHVEASSISPWPR
jgi:hypothetical protein